MKFFTAPCPAKENANNFENLHAAFGDPQSFSGVCNASSAIRKAFQEFAKFFENPQSFLGVGKTFSGVRKVFP